MAGAADAATRPAIAGLMTYSAIPRLTAVISVWPTPSTEETNELAVPPAICWTS